jgi:hypothetical protein
MLRTVGLGVMKAGDVGMLKERVEGMLGSGDQLAAVDVPSGVLVGVSPVNVPVADKGARKDGVAGHFWAAACVGGRRR